MTIVRLPPDAINQIAAGEVIERPAAAVKELVENALDAGASSIRILAEDGGITRLLVEDDGGGIPRDQLSLAVERHATSKLAPDANGHLDLLNIVTMGFRGEALPSIGAIARLAITSRAKDADQAWTLRVEGGVIEGPMPAPWPNNRSGTRVEVRDLFFATPARLNFAKSARSESWPFPTSVSAWPYRGQIVQPICERSRSHVAGRRGTQPAEVGSVAAILGAMPLPMLW